MSKYYKVPLYRDYNCTDYVKYFKILSIEDFQPLWNSYEVRTYTGWQGDTREYRCGVRPNQYWYVASSTPANENLEHQQNYHWMIPLSATYRNKISVEVTLGASIHTDSVDDGFNLLKLIPVNTTYYFKRYNGVTAIRCRWDTASDNYIYEYSLNNSTWNLITQVKHPTYTPPLEVWVGSNTYTILGSIQTLLEHAKNVLEDSSHYITNMQCAPYWCFLTPGGSMGSGYRDFWTFSTSVSACKGSDNELLTVVSRAAASGQVSLENQSATGMLYAMFGTNSFSNIEDAILSDFYEDDNNTYPGGGDDQNDYPEDGESGKGDFDNINDPIDFPTLPTFDVQSTGFISLWRPTITQLTSLYTFLWDSDISTTLKKLFNEPMNAIFSLGIIPVDPVTQGTRRLTIGHVDTEIDMESIQKQFVTFDFGSIDINEYYGAAWDYSPYTHASIYLPYIGVQPVDIDDIMNCTLTLRYNIDVLTGTTIALLKCARKGRDNLNAVMYEWQGNCVTQCPITAGNWSQIMASVIQLGAMTGLALSQPVVGAIGSAVGSSAAAEYAQGKNLVNPTMATYGALNVLGSKVHVQRGGRLDMSSGAMSMQKAFVILNRPVSGIPRGWNKYAGYPSLKIKTLGSQEGFVSVGAIKLDGLRATAEEINELDTILKTGVII